LQLAVALAEGLTLVTADREFARAGNFLPFGRSRLGRIPGGRPGWRDQGSLERTL